MKTYARPVIGSKPVDSITTEDILKILTPIWTDKTETAKRVRGRIENILDYAAAHKYCDPLNPARWRGHLDKLLPKPSRIKIVIHHPAMPYTDVPTIMAKLSSNNSMSAMALRFLILTATRTSEVLQARRSEFDLKMAIWTIPASRMKANKTRRRRLEPRSIILIKQGRIGIRPYAPPEVSSLLRDLCALLALRLVPL